MRKYARPFPAALFAMFLLASACGDTTTDATVDAGSTETTLSPATSGTGSGRDMSDTTADDQHNRPSQAEPNEVSGGDDHPDESTVDDGTGHGLGGTGELLDVPADQADVVITATVAGGDLQIAERRFQVEVGSTVGLQVESDAEEVVHVHGYDLLIAVGPDSPVDVSFLADSPGTFEVEFEMSGRFLFEIQVR